MRPMSDYKHAKSYRDLEVYQRAFEISWAVFKASRSFPKEEKYSLTDQVRRASRSIGAQIAEAWGKRRYEKHFISKLTDADSEQLETQHWINVAVSCGYLDEDLSEDLIGELERIGRMLNSMMRKANLFCGSDGSVAREVASHYGMRPYRLPITDHRLPRPCLSPGTYRLPITDNL